MSYPAEAVLSNKITRNRTVPSFKDSPQKNTTTGVRDNRPKSVVGGVAATDLIGIPLRPQKRERVRVAVAN